MPFVHLDRNQTKRMKLFQLDWITNLQLFPSPSGY
nr:MAG TPA: hypothetical protein [Caudoviricetes sp.]